MSLSQLKRELSKEFDKRIDKSVYRDKIFAIGNEISGLLKKGYSMREIHALLTSEKYKYAGFSGLSMNAFSVFFRDFKNGKLETKTSQKPEVISSPIQSKTDIIKPKNNIIMATNNKLSNWE
jgi:hypothetical protein